MEGWSLKKKCARFGTVCAVLTFRPAWSIVLGREGGLSSSSDYRTLSAAESVAHADYIPKDPSLDVFNANLGGKVAALSERALKEAGLQKKDVSAFGRQVPKFPRSFVENVRNMSHEKVYNFNFIGMLYSMNTRIWIVPFINNTFTEHDYLKFTNVANLKRYRLMGSYDHSPFEACDGNCVDPNYWEVMASSNFTLAPGGDHPYSNRFYEAILAGSIPIIGTKKLCLDFPFGTVGSIPYHYYHQGDKNIEYRQDWADENLELFLRYQTFMQGDNVPKGWDPKKKSTFNPNQPKKLLAVRQRDLDKWFPP